MKDNKREEKRIKEKTKPFCTFVVARLSSSEIGASARRNAEDAEDLEISSSPTDNVVGV